MSVNTSARAAAHPTPDHLTRKQTIVAFWTKLNNDWIFNWAATLAYELLVSLIPVLIAIFAVGGLIIGSVSPATELRIEHTIVTVLFSTQQQFGAAIVHAAISKLTKSAGLLLIASVVVALVTGSGLFVTLEGFFGIVFRLPSRNAIRQRVMAVLMLLLYAILVPCIILASTVPFALARFLAISQKTAYGAILLQVTGLLVAFVAATLLFGAIYVVVPNRKINVRQVWQGTLVTAALSVLYQVVFPIYATHMLLNNGYGALVGLLTVLLAYFYYLAFIVLLGAEINAWIDGRRDAISPLQALLKLEAQLNSATGTAAPDTPASASGMAAHSRVNDTLTTDKRHSVGGRVARRASGFAVMLLAALVLPILRKSRDSRHPATS